MKKKYWLATILLWTARIWSSISLAFLLFMIGAHLIASLTGKGEPLGHPSISFLFFPVSTIIGLAVALKWNGLGGLITVGGIIVFHIFRPDLFFDLMIDGLAFPGLLFLFYWLIKNLPDNHKKLSRN